MKVRCFREYPTDEQMARLGPSYYRNQSFHLTVGKEYTVLGMAWYTDARLVGSGVWVDLASDYGRLSSAPMALFSVTDGRASRFWEVRQTSEGDVSLWPPSFYAPHYHEALAEGNPENVADFENVRSLLESEFTPRSSSLANGLEQRLVADILSVLDNLGSAYDILSTEETINAAKWLKATFPLVPPGRVQWDVVPRSVCSRWRTADELIHAFLDLCARKRLRTPLVTVLWNDILRPAIRLPLDGVQRGAGRILDTGGGLWLICESQRWCIEVSYEGNVCYGEAAESPGA